MLRCCLALLTGLGMVPRILEWLAAQSRDSKVVPFIGSAALDRDNMLNDPILTWTKLPSAFAAASMPFQEQLGDLLICQPDARIMVPCGSHGANQLRSQRPAANALAWFSRALHSANLMPRTKTNAWVASSNIIMTLARRILLGLASGGMRALS